MQNKIKSVQSRIKKLTIASKPCLMKTLDELQISKQRIIKSSKKVLICWVTVNCFKTSRFCFNLRLKLGNNGRHWVRRCLFILRRRSQGCLRFLSLVLLRLLKMILRRYLTWSISPPTGQTEHSRTSWTKQLSACRNPQKHKIRSAYWIYLTQTSWANWSQRRVILVQKEWFWRRIDRMHLTGKLNLISPNMVRKLRLNRFLIKDTRIKLPC